MQYSMKLVSLLASVALVNAHATVFNIFVNDVDQGLGNTKPGYIRSPPNNSPVKDITSKDLTCNVANVAAAKYVEVKGGDKISIEWHHDSNQPSDDIIAESHKGPIITYIAPAASNGEGAVWVKFAEETYDATTKKWAVDNLRANKGRHTVVLPDVPAGDYIIRDEIIALHESDAAFNTNPNRGAQFYPSCIQVRVTSAGTKTLPAGNAIPGVYKYSDPGVVFNLYGAFTSYTAPGGPVWDGVSGGAAAPASAAPESTKPAVIPTPASPAASKPATTLATVTKPAGTPASIKAPSAAPAAPTGGSCPAPVTVTVGGNVAAASVAPPAAGASAPAAGSVAKWQQCGGIGFVGAACAAGLTCTAQNAYYSQCL